MIRFILEVKDFILRNFIQLGVFVLVVTSFVSIDNQQRYVKQLSVIRRANLRVPYNPLYKNTECKDWQSDSTVSMERRNVYKYWQDETKLTIVIKN